MERALSADELTTEDPWAPPAQRPPGGLRAGIGLLLPRLAAWVLGALAPVLRVLPNGDDGRRGAAVLAAATLVFALLLPRGRITAARSVAAASVAVAGVLLTVPTIGRAPALVAFGSVAVAHAALLGVRLRRVDPARETPRAGLAVPLLAFSAISWYRHGETSRVVLLLAAAVLVIGLYRWRPDRVGRIDLAVTRAVVAFARGVASALLLLALLVTLYLPGAVVGAIARIRRTGATGSTWVVARNSVADQRRDASFPFVTTPPAEAHRRLLAGLAVVAVVATSAWLIVRPEPAEQAGATSDDQGAPAAPARTPEDAPILFGREFDARYTDLPAYRDEPWADDLQAQEAAVPSAQTFNSRYINLSDGRRVTVAPQPCDCPAAEVWLTGGSAVWGIGQRDEHTVASALVEAAGDTGLRLFVDNMGQRGSVFDEQIDEVEARLRNEPAPDLIVFYNGFNEIGAALSDVFLRNGDPDDLDALEGGQQDLQVSERMDDLDEINARIEGYLQSDVGPETAAAMVTQYRAGMARMDEIARRYGVEVRYVFQADALASRHQLDPYELISNVPTDVMAASPISIALAEAADTLGDEVINLRGVFDDEDEQVFLGLVHHNEAGARTVAERLRAVVAEAVAEG